MCYPLFRNWNLSVKVLDDVKKVIKLGKQEIKYYFIKIFPLSLISVLLSGKKYIIKRLCEIHSLFNNSCEPRYMLNQLYIKDYLVWLQQIHESLIESLDSLIIDVSIIIMNK